MKRRLFSLLLCGAMLLSMCPPGLALEAEAGGLCPHHQEHSFEDCGYTEAVEDQPCGHVHDGDCGFVEAAKEIPCDMDCPETGEDGQIIHAEGCGYVPEVEGTPCQHEHDELCGYVCPVCPVQAIIDTLPTAGELNGMSEDEQNESYNALQAAYDAYEALTDEQKEEITEAEIFESLFAFFSGMANLLEAQEVSIEDGAVTITADACGSNCPGHTITGTGADTTNTITVESGTHHITLQSVQIDVSGQKETAAFSIADGAAVNLTLCGANILKSGFYCAGLQVQNSAVLVITESSTGSLDVTGGEKSAGIGSGFNVKGGTITINGGAVTANGGGFNVDTTKIPAEAFDGSKQTLTIQWGGDDNLNSSKGSVDAVFNKKELTVTGATAENRIYDGTDKVKITAVTLDGIVNSDAVSVKIDGLNGTISGSNAGTYNAVTLPTLSLTDDNSGYYTLAQPAGAVPANVSIDKATPTVTQPTAASGLTYNGEAQNLINAGNTSGGTLQYSIDGTTYSPSIPVGTNAKTYTVYYKVDGGNNYNDVAAQSVSATIGKVTPSVQVTIVMSGNTGARQAVLTITVTATKAEDEHYNAATATLTVYVAKKAVVFKANDKTVQQGGTMPTFDYAPVTLAQGDSITTQPIATCTATDTNTTGTFPITLSSAVLSNGDSYNISYQTGTLTVTAKPSTGGGYIPPTTPTYPPRWRSPARAAVRLPFPPRIPNRATPWP